MLEKPNAQPHNRRYRGVNHGLPFIPLLLIVAVLSIPMTSLAQMASNSDSEKEPHAIVRMELSSQGTATLSFKFLNVKTGGAYYTLVNFPRLAKVTSDPLAPPHLYGWLRRDPNAKLQEVIVGVAQDNLKSVRIMVTNRITPQFRPSGNRPLKSMFRLAFPDTVSIMNLNKNLEGLFVPVTKLVVMKPENWASIAIKPKANVSSQRIDSLEVAVADSSQISVHITPSTVPILANLFQIALANAGIFIAIIVVFGALSVLTKETHYQRLVRLALVISLGLLSVYNIVGYVGTANLWSFLNQYDELMTVNLSMLIAAVFFKQLDTAIEKIKNIT